MVFLSSLSPLWNVIFELCLIFQIILRLVSFFRFLTLLYKFRNRSEQLNGNHGHCLNLHKVYCNLSFILSLGIWWAESIKFLSICPFVYDANGLSSNSCCKVPRRFYFSLWLVTKFGKVLLWIANPTTSQNWKKNPLLGISKLYKAQRKNRPWHCLSIKMLKCPFCHQTKTHILFGYIKWWTSFQTQCLLEDKKIKL